MNCPVCSKQMVEQDFGGVTVDVCSNGCKSLWFDWLELQRLDEKDEGFGDAIKEAMNFPRTNDADRAPLICPKCGIKMHAHKYQSSKETNVDECYACGGFFLDSGELQLARETFMTQAEELAYVDKLLAGNPEIQKEMADLEQMKARTATVNKFTKYLRPSYWATGK